VVVVPLYDVDVQAGVTAILEAIAMAKPVVVTHTQGQFDMVEDRRAATRGSLPRIRPVSLLRAVAREAGEDVKPNGFYVEVGDPSASRRALTYLLDHPREGRVLGEAGGYTVERFMTVDQFAARMAALVDEAARAARGLAYSRRAVSYLRVGRTRSAEAEA